MDGLDPRTAGLLSMAAGLFQAGGVPPRGQRPTSLGQALGNAIPQGMLSYQSATKMQQDAEEARALQQYRQMQMQEMQRKIAMEEKAREDRDKFIKSLPPELQPYMGIPGFAEAYGGGLGKAMTETPKKEKLVQIKVKGPDGKPRIEFVTPDEAASYEAYEPPPSQMNVTLGGGQWVQNPDGTFALVQPANRMGVPPQVAPMPKGTVPIGYADDRKKEEQAKTKDKLKVASARNKAATVSKKVEEALANVNKMTTGLVGAIAGKVPGTSAYDLRGAIDTIKANIGFQELADMRAASPTGGALGQIAVQELVYLQAAIASLDPSQSEAVVKKNLDAVNQHFKNWQKAVEEAYSDTYSEQAPASGSGQPGNTQGGTVIDFSELP